MMRSSMRMILGLAFCGMLGLESDAEQAPQSLSSDARIQQVIFDPNNVVKIQSAVLTNTQVIFAENERIQEVQNGDAAAWSSSLNTNLPNMIFLKPLVKDSDTNMTVVTNHHIYYFELDSTTKANSTPSYAIKFIYPNDMLSQAEEAIALKAEDQNLTISAFQNPSQFNWDYSYNGDKAILPLHMFDDGKFTYLDFPLNAPIPAVFMIDNSAGKEAVLNVRMQGHYLLIETVAPQFTLRLGSNHVASVFNNKKIAQLRGKHS